MDALGNRNGSNSSLGGIGGRRLDYTGRDDDDDYEDNEEDQYEDADGRSPGGVRAGYDAGAEQDEGYDMRELSDGSSSVEDIGVDNRDHGDEAWW